MIETVQRPLIIYAMTLRSGRLLDLFASTYVTYWLAFLVVAIAVYWFLARMLFANLDRDGMRVAYSSQAAIVAGTFGIVCAFYAVFMFSPAASLAWVLEVTLLLVWFLFFIFSWATTSATLD